MANNPLGGLGGLLGSLFGQGTAPQDIQRFDQQYASGQHQSLDDAEVQQRYRQVLRNAPPEIVEDAHAQAFSQLSPQQRRELAQRLRQQAQQLEAPYGSPYDQDQQDDDPRTLARMAQQAEQRNPGVLDQLFGGQPGPLNNPLVKMAMAGAAALAARRFLGGQMGSPLGGLDGQMGGQLGGSPLGGLGGLLGGAQNSGLDTSGGSDQGFGESSGGSFDNTQNV